MNENTPAPKRENDLYVQIRSILNEARSSAYRSINFTMVQAYWRIGMLIIEHEQDGKSRAEYGKAVLEDLSKKLTIEFGKGFSVQNLRYMRQFYRLFRKRHAVRGESIDNVLRPELSWTHYRLLLRVESDKARQWYMNEAASQNWSTRQLDRQISTLYYDRLLASQDKAPVIQEAAEKLLHLKPSHFIRDPYVLEFLDLKDYPGLKESVLEQAIIDKLQQFLLEIGKGFSFVARQKRMRFGEEVFFIDLVFYNFILKCFVLIDLKIGRLAHQDIGQMDSYVRMYEDHEKVEGDNPTIGLILCSEKNEAIARYSVLNGSKQLFASKYMLYLPTEDELEHELMRERQLIEEKQPTNDLT